MYGALAANDGALVAEALANRGRQVYFVTPYETVMPYGGISHRMETPGILRRKLAAIYTEAMIGIADGRRVSVVRPDSGHVADLEVGAIVAITAPKPRAELTAVAIRLGVPYTLIGDAMAPRTATDAFREGEVAALQL